MSRNKFFRGFWDSVDWSLTNTELASRHNVNESTVRKARRKRETADTESEPPTLRSWRSTTVPPEPAPGRLTCHSAPIDSEKLRASADGGKSRSVQNVYLSDQGAHNLSERENLPRGQQESLIRPPAPREHTKLAPQPKWLHRLLFVPDSHRPYHDPLAWSTMLAAAHTFKPTIVAVLGDFIDCYSVSSHSRNPQRVSQLEDEVLSGKDGLDQLDAIPGVQRKVFVEGNHEDRLRRYLWDKAPALFGMVDTATLLGLDRRGWEFVPHGEGIQIGKVFVTHDLGKCGKYAVSHALTDAGKSVVIGHLHRIQIIYGGSAFGQSHVAACFGWLARNDVAADYRHKLIAQREYQHGFGIGYMEPDGTVHLQAIPIVNGRCCIEGRIVQVEKDDDAPCMCGKDGAPSLA